MYLKNPTIVTVLATVVFTYCKPAPDQTRGNSPGVGSPESTAIATTRSTAPENSTSGALVTTASRDTEEVKHTSINGGGLQCLPRVFSLRDTITLQMEAPHGEYLMVTRTDSTNFFLTYPYPREPRNYLLVPSETFAQMPIIRFRATVRAKPRIYGRDTLEPVFNQPGGYVLTIGHNLQSEASSEIYKCTIRLAPEK